VGDFNGDGKLDLAVTRPDFIGFGAPENGGEVDLLIGNGDGTFTTSPLGALSLPNDHPQTVAVADLNNDGKLDLIVAGGETVDVWLGNGDGTFHLFSQQGLSPAATTTGIAVGDFTGDGSLDVALIGFSPSGYSALEVLFNSGRKGWN
jgi:hypothetical protein